MIKRVLAVLAAALMFFAASASAQTEELPSLKDFYAPYFDFGSAMNSMEVRMASGASLYTTQYSIVTPENALKPDSVLDVAASRKASQEDQGNVAVSFKAVKGLLDFTQENGIKVHGHVLFWHSQTPDVFFRESYAETGDYVSREVMLKRMENFVRLVMEYMQENYPGLIVSWDVVNEAIDDSTGKLREGNWTSVVGDDFVVQAFRFAREYAPEGTLLFYNDYSTPYQPKLTGILNLLDSLLAVNLVDGYGFQCHYQINSPSIFQLTSALQKIVDRGLLVRISELDIQAEDNSEEQFQLQAERYTDLMKLFLQYSDSIIAVETWGTEDTYSWKSESYPLLFNGDGTPKPAFYAITDPAILP